MPGIVITLFISAIVWNYIKVSTRRAIVYLIVDLIVRSIEYVLYFLFGFMTMFWIIDIAAEKGWIEGWGVEETVPTTKEGGILSEPNEAEEEIQESEDQDEGYESDGIHIKISQKAYS